MVAYDSDDDRRRERYTRERAGGDRNGTDDRRAAKRSFNGSRRDDESGPKRARNDSESAENVITLRQFAENNSLELDAPETLTKYMAYVLELDKNNANTFFHAHKDEEWFKTMYHPEQKAAADEKFKETTQKRLSVYEEFKDKGLLDGLSLAPENARQVVRLLNAAIIRLNGKSDEDVQRALNMCIHDSDVHDVILEEVPNDESNVEEPDLIQRNAGILIRCIPKTATQSELEEVCQRSPGFLRLQMLAPEPDANWMRKAVATFRLGIDLNDVCTGLKNVELKDGGLFACIPDCSDDRVRVGHALLNHKQIAGTLLYRGLKILVNLDKKAGIFCQDETSTSSSSVLKPPFNLSTNPLVSDALAIIPSSCKDEVYQRTPNAALDSVDVVFTKDESLLRHLDQVAFYLRIVHSFDLFDFASIDHEDNMPNLFERMHIRGKDVPPNEQQLRFIKRGEIRAFEEEILTSLDIFCKQRTLLSGKVLDNLGRIDPDAAIEKLIADNTKQLGEDKWLCPLSGKKFKGPEFIRKHILSKHAEVVDATLYFNNFLADPCRPSEPIDTQEKALDPRGSKTALWSHLPERRRNAVPIRRDDRSPRKDSYRDAAPSFPARRALVGYRDLDAVSNDVF